MSGNNSSPASPIPDDKMMAYLYDDVDDADIFGFGHPRDEEGTKIKDDHSEGKPENLEVLDENQMLKETIQKLQLEKDTLERKISEVYKTAKNEIERKDKRLQELQEETNNLLFRRKKVQEFGYKENHHGGVRFEEQQHLPRKKNDNINDTKFENKGDHTEQNTAQKVCSVQIEDIKPPKGFNNDYKIPKKINDNSKQSEQKLIESNVLVDSDSLTPTRHNRYQDNIRLIGRPNIPVIPPRFKSENLNCQDDPKKRQRGCSKTPPRNKSYHDKPKTPSGSLLRCKSRSKSAENCEEVGQIEKRVHDNTPSRRNRTSTEIKHRSPSRSPQRHKNYQDRSRNPKTSARSSSRYKSRSKSSGNRIEADPRDTNRKREYPSTPSRRKTVVNETEHRTSSRSPHRHNNYEYKPRQPKTSQSPLRHKSRSTSGENRKIYKERVNSNSPSRAPTDCSETNRHKSSSGSPQRHKSYQGKGNQPITPPQSPLRHKSKSASPGSRIEAVCTISNRERNYSSRSPQSHENYQERPNRPKPLPGAPIRHKSRSASVEADPKDNRREREQSNSPSREHRSAPRSPQRNKNYQDRPRQNKSPLGSPTRHKSRSASGGADPKDANRERERSKSPSREHKSSSRSSQRHENYQERPRKPKPPPGSQIRHKSRSASVGADPKDNRREREQSNSPSKEHRSAPRSPQRHKNYQDSPRQTKLPLGSPTRHKSRSALDGADPEDTKRKREQSNSPSREHKSSSRSSQRPENYQERSRKPERPPGSPRRHISRSASVEADPKDNKREREQSNSPSREHRSAPRSPQRHKNYQDGPRQTKPPPRSPTRQKSRSASGGADPKDANRERERSKSPSREHKSSSRSSQRHENYQERPRKPKPPPGSPIRHISRSASVEADRKDNKREREQSNFLHRSSSRSPQRHKNYQDRPRQTKQPLGSPTRHKSRSASGGAYPKDANRERDRSNSTSREHKSSSRSSRRNYQERPRQRKPPPESRERNKSRSASAETKGDTCERKESRVINEEKHNRFGPPFTKKADTVDQYEQKRPPRTPSGSPPRTRRPRTPSPKRNSDKRRQSRPSERGTRGRTIDRRLRWEGRKGSYRRFNNDYVEKERYRNFISRRPRDYKTKNDYKKRQIQQLRQRIKQRRDPETIQFNRQESDSIGDKDILRMSDEELLRLIHEKRKELISEEELNDIEEGQLTGEDENIYLPTNAENDEKLNKSKKQTYEALLKETKNITKQAQKDVLGIKKPEISPNLQVKLLETIRSPDTEDPRLNPSSLDSKAENPRARINLEAYKKRREEKSCSDLARIAIYEEFDIESHTKTRESVTIIAESQKEGPEGDLECIKEKSDHNDQKAEEKEAKNLLESDYKYTPAVYDEDSKLDIPEDKNSLNSFLDDFDLSEDDDKFRNSDSFSTENKENQAQKEILENKTTKMFSNLETKACKIIKSEDSNPNPTVNDLQPDRIEVSSNFETYNQQNEVSSDLTSAGSKSGVTDKIKSDESVEIIKKHETSERSDNTDPAVTEYKVAQFNSFDNLNKSDDDVRFKKKDSCSVENVDNMPIVEDKVEILGKVGSSCAEKVDNMPIVEDEVQILDKVGSSCSVKKVDNMPIIVEDKVEILDKVGSSCAEKVDNMPIAEDDVQILDKVGSSCSVEKVDNMPIIVEDKVEILDKVGSSCAKKVDNMPIVEVEAQILDKVGSSDPKKIEIVSLPIIDVKKCEAKTCKVTILSNVVIAAGFKSLPQTSKKSENMESESMENIQKAVLNIGIENKSLDTSKKGCSNPQLSTEDLKMSLEGEEDKTGQKSDQNSKDMIVALFGEMTPSPCKPLHEAKIQKKSRQVQQVKRQLKLQVNPVKTIKKSPRSRKKVEPKQLLMQSEIVENKEVKTQTVATKLKDLRHNNPSFYPYLPGDNKAFDTPNTYILKKNKQKKKPAAKKSKETKKPKVEAKKREVFKIKFQTSRKKKKSQNNENTSSEFSCDAYSDCESSEPENNKKLKMEPKKSVTRKSKTAQEKVEEVKKKGINNDTINVIENENPEHDIKIQSAKFNDDGIKSEDIEYTGTQTNKRSTANSVKVGEEVKTEAKVTDISGKCKNIENTQTQTNKKCKEDISDGSENTVAKTNERHQADIIEEKVTAISEDNFKNSQETKINKRNRAKPVKVVRIDEKFSDNNKDKGPNIEKIAHKRCQTTPVEVSDTAKIEQEISNHNEDKSENSKNTKTNSNKRTRAKLVKAEVVKIQETLTGINEDKPENSQNNEIISSQAEPEKVNDTVKIDEKNSGNDKNSANAKTQACKRNRAKPVKVEVVKIEENLTAINEVKIERSQNSEPKTGCQVDSEKVDNTLEVEEKIADITENKSETSEYTDSKVTKRRRIQPVKVGEVIQSNKRKRDTQEDTITNKLPKLEQSPLPQMESMLKQLQNKSGSPNCDQRYCTNKITAVNIENGVVEININSKDVFSGAMENLIMLEDLSTYLNVSDRKTESSFSNFQLNNLNTSTPKKSSENKKDNVDKNLVENEIEEDKVSPVAIANVSDSPKEFLPLRLRRDRRKRIRVELVSLS